LSGAIFCCDFNLNGAVCLTRWYIMHVNSARV
jgi:hypothetical protein